MGYVRNMLQLQYDDYLYIQAYLNSKGFGSFGLTLLSQPIYPNPVQAYNFWLRINVRILSEVVFPGHECLSHDKAY